MPLPFSPPFSQMNRDSQGFVVQILSITSHSALQNYTVLSWVPCTCTMVEPLGSALLIITQLMLISTIHHFL